jgi:hypothetical protein
MIIPCLVPLKDGHVLQPEFYAGLLNQTQQVVIMPVSRPPIPAGKYPTQALVRNRLFTLVEEVECEFVAMLDCDNIVSDPNALSAAIIKLSEASDLKVVHFRFKPRYTPGHFDIGGMLFTKEVIYHITFTCDNPQVCNCTGFSEQIARAGWKQDWLSDDLQGRSMPHIKEG